MMAPFDFSNVKATESKEVPSLTRTRQSKPNPLAGEYDRSDSVQNAQKLGKWLHLDLPGEVSSVKDDAGKERVHYGDTIKQAQNYLRQAAAAKGRGVSFRVEEADEKNKLKPGILRLHFQAKPKRGRDSA